ncbi:MAG TPA: leucyl aminopeptidase [Vicinamibacterales bacterium]|nr:leucyl aminopeptidase [Vicinamibacterales bacterium]
MSAVSNSSSSPSALTSSTARLADVDVDLLVLPWFEGEAPGPLQALDRAVGLELSRALGSKEFSARPFELLVTPVVDQSWKPKRVMLVGAGPAAAFDGAVARRVASAAVLAARQRRAARIAFALRHGLPAVSGDLDMAGVAQAVAEGLTLGEFNGSYYKTIDPPPSKIDAFTIVLPDGAGDTSPESLVRVNDAISRGRLLGECSNLAREMANEPGNGLTPRAFAERGAGIVSAAGAGVEILDEKQIEALGMGMLLGVARGSSEPPRLMVFRHEPPNAPKAPVLALVGKGITFDSGGISIKPADGMERMKDDMAGGAAVICAMRAIAMLNAPIRVIGIVPACENMPGGRAMKPGDILRSAEGSTVEVINTDAEGRLVLGDALWYARRLGATHLVDVATLTGAILVALGKTTTGLFGTPDSWVQQVRRVADRAGDRSWPLPVFDDYREQLKSEIADFSNTGGRPAGSITAALFLKEFTGGLPWVHLDIAGTVWIDEAKPYFPKGPTGVAVRTLAELPFTADTWK